MSNALRGYWFIIFPMIGLIIYTIRRLKRTPEGTRAWDRFKLRVPMKIGDVVQKIALARISRTLATLVSAGVDIITALDIAAGTAGNWVLETALQRTSARVHDGVPISVPLAEDENFPPMVSQMVKIGEETGELDKMLGKIADFYEDEVDCEHRLAHVDHRAVADDLRRSHGGNHRHRDVPADVQAPHADQVKGSGASRRR